jgi:hypothetical protein
MNKQLRLGALALAVATPLYAQTAGMRTDGPGTATTGASPPAAQTYWSRANCSEPSRRGTADCAQAAANDKTARKAPGRDRSAVINEAGPEGKGAVRGGG